MSKEEKEQITQWTQNEIFSKYDKKGKRRSWNVEWGGGNQVLEINKWLYLKELAQVFLSRALLLLCYSQEQ